MSSTSKILLNKITDEIVIQMLRAIIPVLESLGINYFVVGAFARDLGLLTKEGQYLPVRKTRDIDIAVLTGSLEEYEILKAAVTALPEFEPSDNEPYRFLFRQAYEVDFLPFGEIVNEKGQVELKAKQTFILEMPGFDAAYLFAESIDTDEGITLKVSSLSGVVLLKLLAWQDRPEREKDIQDIDHILNNFYLLHVAEIIETGDDLLDIYENEVQIFNQLVSARYVGRQMGVMLESDPALRNRVQQLLRVQSDRFDMARLLTNSNIEESQRVIKAMLDGLNDTPTRSDAPTPPPPQ